MTLTQLSLPDFLDRTADNQPVPGGGSISALCGALAAALAKMVTGLTIGRKKYAEYDAPMTEIAQRLLVARERLLAQVDADADAYNKVFAAFKMPKETEEEKAVRNAAIQAATVEAIEAPLTTAHLCDDLMDDIRFIADHGNQNAITDACVAMMCARTGILGAVLNVRINLDGLDDKEAARNYADECNGLVEHAMTAENALLSSVSI